MTSQPHDMYYENPNQRSPGSHRHTSHPTQRHPSRPMDLYGSMAPPPSLYANEDSGGPQNFVQRYGDNRMNATMGSGYPAYDTWGAPPFGSGQSNTLAAIGATGRRGPLPNRSGRAGLPPNWVDPPPMPGMPTFGGLDNGINHEHIRQDGGHSGHGDVDEELIPTAIVIKNIPFAVKKEQLVGVMTDMGLPLPYAFNYHFDQGVFRGLAFANFTTAEETAVVINALNHYDLAGRKLRVEYKKMLPLVERERIEREKRIKRGQLEEQHRPIPATQLQNQSSLSSLTSQMPTNSPSPVSSRPRNPGFPAPGPTSSANNLDPRSMPGELDFNDPQVLQIYSELIVFKNSGKDEYSFPATLSPTQRRMVHTIAHHLRLAHVSKGNGDQRAVQIYRYAEQVEISPSNLPAGHPADTQRRALNRAATTDFTDVRSDGYYSGPSAARQPSGLFSVFPDSPNGLHASHNLRAAKSYHDLRSYTPSPVPSTASFPTNLTNNIARFTEYGVGSTGASNPNLTSTATTLAGREEILGNGMSALSLGGGFGPGGSPRSTRNMWDAAPGPIGSNRAFSATTQSLDEQTRERNQAPQRQPRGPAPERGPGFGRPRQNGHSGRGSDELTTPIGNDLGSLEP